MSARIQKLINGSMQHVFLSGRPYPKADPPAIYEDIKDLQAFETIRCLESIRLSDGGK